MKKKMYKVLKFKIKEYCVGDIITSSPGGGTTELPPVWDSSMFKQDAFGDGNESSES